MANRGQKRMEIVDDLPSDKRACSSLEFRPSSSNSSIQTQINSMNSTSETHDADMDTSSSDSDSSRSEEVEPQRDLAHDSCNSGGVNPRSSSRSLRDYQRQRSSAYHDRLKSALCCLSEATEPSGQLAALTELCEVLSFCIEDSLSSMMADTLSPILVKLARLENNPDIMLFAIRALTYLCDVFPQASAFLVRHDAVAALCQRLMAIEYLDVAEQCLQALEKISREQPLACLQAGAIMAVLKFIDFFSTSVQRVALLTVVNICKKLPTECPSLFMEAVPILCNLLQYEDQQLVENVAICLIRIAEQLSQSSGMLEEICKHGLINQATHLIQLNSRTTLSQPTYNGLIGLLAKLSSCSTLAFRTLYELNISAILREILATYGLSHGVSAPQMVDGQGNQVHEVLKLLNELLPTVERDQDNHHLSDKELFLLNDPDVLLRSGLDVLPMLMQVVNSGANLYVCYGCLSVINKLVYFSKSDMLVELLNGANIPSFLAGVFTRKDHHVLMLALQIAEVILQKRSDVFLNSFIKEGVFFAIDTLLKPENCSNTMFPVSEGTQLPYDSGQKHASKVVLRCLCYAFGTCQSPSAGTGTCKLENNSVQNLAKGIKASYFDPVLCDSKKGLTDTLQKLSSLSTALSDLMHVPTNADDCSRDEEKFYCLLHQVVAKLSGREPISTFEFVESGIVKSLVNYMSNGHYLSANTGLRGICDDCYILEKRFEVFARMFLASPDLADELPIAILIRKLQSALSSWESFPVILSFASKQKSSFATVPHRRCLSHPCLRVRFIREDGETSLCDYSEDSLTVDPFSSLDEIEGFLLPKVRLQKLKQMDSTIKFADPMEVVPLQLPSDANSSQGESSDLVDPDHMPADLSQILKTEAQLSQHSPEQAIIVGLENLGEASSSIDTHIAGTEQAVQFPSGSDISVKSEHLASRDNGNAFSKLSFYLKGKKLDQTSSIYQAILQQKYSSDIEMNSEAKLWSQVHTLTYRMSVEPKDDHAREYSTSAEDSSLLNKSGAHMQCTSFFSNVFGYELASDLDKSSPTYDILFLLKSLECLNRFAFHLLSCEKLHAFTDGLIDNLDYLGVVVHSVSQNEFVSSKLTEKLEQQMRDPLAVSTGGMPLWCNQLMISCPFLFSFETKCKYFRLLAFGPQKVRTQVPSQNSSGVLRDRRLNAGNLPRKKFLVWRDQILESASQMLALYAHINLPIEVVYDEEVGTGLGPTLEFYTLVSHEFQKFGLGMWRGDYGSPTVMKTLQTENSGFIMSPFGLFPRPWPSVIDTSYGIKFSEVLNKFVLLGKVVAKALQDGRVLDLPFSKAFYKLMLQQELNLYDIQSFDPELGRTLLEFLALANRKKKLGSFSGENSTSGIDMRFRNTRVEDLCIDFTLPGHPDCILTSDPDCQMVNMDNLEEYVALVVDATIHAGISRQAEAFKSGFNEVFPIKHLQIFTEEEVERLLCGEHDLWDFNELLDHIKFDHGYTSSSPPISNLLEIIREFNHEERRAFLQFVTGAPRLPPGGLASLNPKLTIVRKHFSKCQDADLPSVMTCANYLKLPPYSSKDKMRDKLLYAIREGQGSFHLS